MSTIASTIQEQSGVVDETSRAISRSSAGSADIAANGGNRANPGGPGVPGLPFIAALRVPTA
ncbi:hypothetical protein ACQPZJ_22755 [Actinoplanes sp. CA-054009]